MMHVYSQGNALGPRGKAYSQTQVLACHFYTVVHVCSQGNALDEEARARGTSVYLVQKVIPMLPRLLCEKLCSLNSGESCH